MRGSLEFLTPAAGLLAVLALLPITALVVAGRRVRRVRTLLRLSPAASSGRLRVVALAAVPVLLALALAQPVVRRHSSAPARPDTAVFVVVDTSSSMAAGSSSTAPTRLALAKRAAIAVGAQLPGVPIGVASFTDRVLPNLFPTIDRAALDSTIRSLSTDSPPPRETSRVATSFAALRALARSSFFTRGQTHRALLLLTDGESRAFSASSLARTFAASPQLHVVVVRVGAGDDRLHGVDGRASSVYRPDPEGALRAVDQLTSATGGRAFTGGAAGVAPALRTALGPGPTERVVSEPDTRALAPYVAMLSLIPLLFALKGPSGTVRAERRAS